MLEAATFAFALAAGIVPAVATTVDLGQIQFDTEVAMSVAEAVDAAAA